MGDVAPDTFRTVQIDAEEDVQIQPAELHNQDADHGGLTGWRLQLATALHSRQMLLLGIGLLALDMILVVISAVVEVHNLEKELHKVKEACLVTNLTEEDFEHFVDEDLEMAEKAMFYTSLAILSYFILEGLLLIVVYQVQYFKRKMDMFDLVVVCISLALEVLYGGNGSGLIILARLWRFLRIEHGMKEASKKKRETAHKMPTSSTA
eukprot:m.343758 g.343758  ORF g.343758 m.343758 type:complete len:208 (-) comp23256_c0_seq1:134-757(-)